MPYTCTISPCRDSSLGGFVEPAQPPGMGLWLLIVVLVIPHWVLGWEHGFGASAKALGAELKSSSHRCRLY